MIHIDYFAVLAVILLCIIYGVVMLLKRKAPVEQYVLFFAFLFYIVKVVDVAFFPVWINAEVIADRRELSQGIWLNYLPFATITESIKHSIEFGRPFLHRTLILNIAMFVPMGYLLPLVFQRVSSFKTTVLYSLFISATIETLQLAASLIYGFTYRQANIDDIILNSLGSMLGFLLLLATLPVLKILTRIDRDNICFMRKN